MNNIISIENLKRRQKSQWPQPQPPAGTGNSGRLTNPAGHNQYTRRTLLRMFAVGAGVRKIGRFHPEGEKGLESDIRAALMEKDAA